jgi:hypothetical protein
MARSTTFLNYIAFLILFVTAFIIIYVKNTEIIGYYFFFIINAAFTLYNISYFTSTDGLDLVPYTIGFSLIFTGLSHTVSLIFIVMMISNLRVKYSDTYGTPINLPPIYKDQLELFKRLMIASFSLCGLLLIMYGVRFADINIPFAQQMRTIGGIIANPFPVIVLIITCAPMIMSLINVSIANGFSILTRQQLMR